MAHWTADVADYLATLGLGTVGTNLFWGQLPTSPDEAGAVIPSPGSPAEAIFGAQGVGIEYPRAQVVFRGTAEDASTPFTKAQTAFEALRRDAVTLGTTVFYRLTPIQSPFLRGYGANGGPEVCFTLEAMKEV